MQTNLTIKDFILYKKSCILCKNKLSFKIYKIQKNNINIPFSYTAYNNSLSYDIISTEIISIPLKVNYLSKILVSVNIVTNKYYIDDKRDINYYINDEYIILSSECLNCKCSWMSNPISFNSKKYIEPISISKEYLNLKIDNSKYNIIINFNENKTIINLQTIESYNIMASYLNNFFEIKSVSITKCKTKEELINKIKTILLFV